MITRPRRRGGGRVESAVSGAVLQVTLNGRRLGRGGGGERRRRERRQEPAQTTQTAPAQNSGASCSTAMGPEGGLRRHLHAPKGQRVRAKGTEGTEGSCQRDRRDTGFVLQRDRGGSCARPTTGCDLCVLAVSSGGGLTRSAAVPARPRNRLRPGREPGDRAASRPPRTAAPPPRPHRRPGPLSESSLGAAAAQRT